MISRNSLLLIFLLIASPLFFTSCNTERNLNKNLEKLDKLYGVCDNPQRAIKGARYKVCKDKERAGSGTPLEAINLTEIIENYKNPKPVYASNVNQILWQSSLDKLASYTLKIADYNGGYIETDWINDANMTQRCVIKIQILGPDLLSTSIETIFICQELINNNWVYDGKDYLNEAKNLKIAILNNTNKFKTE